MNPAIVSALVRHLLTAVSGAFAVKYGIDGGNLEALIGGLSAAAGLGWSILDKRARS